MAFSGSGKVWMNGSLVEWADAKIHIASHVIHYGSGVFEGARCYNTPRGSACFRLDAHMRRLFDSARIYRMAAGRRSGDVDRSRPRDDSRQQAQGLLHPSDHLPRLPRAGRQSVPVPGRHRHPHLGMGRLPRTGRARAGRGRARQLVVARRAEHVPDAREDVRELRQLAADQDGSGHRRVTAKASRSTRSAT